MSAKAPIAAPRMAEAPAPSAAMRARAVWWRGLDKVRRRGGPAFDLLLRHLHGDEDWSSFRASASSQDVFTVDAATMGTDELVRRGVALLHEHGVVVLRNLFEPATVHAAAEEALREFMRFEAAQDDREARTGVLDGLRWQTDLEYQADVRAGASALVNFRSRGPREEAGNIGLTNVERLGPARAPALSALLAHPAQAVQERIVAAFHPVSGRDVDLLKKQSVLNTMPAHADTFGTLYLSFLYLLDVPDREAGPYGYLPGSHRRSDLLARDSLRHRIRGERERFFPALNDRILPITGTAGTLVLSCQRGIHRGLPQQSGRLRLAIQRTLT